MASLKTLLLTGATLALLLPAAASAAQLPAGRGLMVVAQAGDPVAAAEKAVAGARAVLRKAMASGKGIKEARSALVKAQQALAQVAAGQPADETPQTEDAAPPPSDQAPAEAAAPPAPPKDKAPAVVDEKPPAAAVTDGAAEAAAPADEQPPPKPGKKKLPTGVVKAAPGEPAPAVVEETPPPAAVENGQAAEAVTPAGDQPPADPAKKKKLPAGVAKATPAEPPAAVVEKTPAAGPSAPDAVAKPPVAVVELAPGEAPPAPAVEDTPPPPPPVIVKAGKAKPADAGESGNGAGAAPEQPVASIAPVGIGQAAADGRIILRLNGEIVIKHDEDQRFRRSGGRVFEQPGDNGQTIVTVNRPDGSQIVTVRDPDGNILRRTRKLADGQVFVLMDSRQADKQKVAEGVDYMRRLPPIVLNIPEQQYIVESQQASEQQIEQTLVAPPVEMVERPYSLDEIRQSGRLRDKVRRIDVDTVNFEFGQATLSEDQVAQLDTVGKALSAVIGRDPAEVYLIEGHTDAVGSDLSNLALSDRRAESVAEILTYYYKIPPENLVTQGYGEQYLKVPTEGPERQNRRVTVRRITPLLKAENQ
jgi:outer membrane protein OmpA-like peptidoglycan-associated protein